MTRAFSLTGADLIRTLSNVARSVAVDTAVRDRAEKLARDAEDDGVTTRVSRRAAADYTVTVSAPNLFAREFGSVDAEAKPVIGPAVRRLTGGD